MRVSRSGIGLAAGAALSLLATPPSARAANCSVNSADDDPADASAKVTAVATAQWSGTNAGTITLRDCLLAANLMTGATGQPTDADGLPVSQPQTVPAMQIDLSALAGQTIVLADTLPMIFNNLRIDGGTGAPVTIDAGHVRRIFFVSGLPEAVDYAGGLPNPDGAQPIAVSFAHLVLQNGYAKGGDAHGGGGLGAGGALFVNQLAYVTLQDVAFAGNAAAGGNVGAGTYGGGGMGMETCTPPDCSNNGAGGGLGQGGGYYNGSGIGTRGTTLITGGFGGQGLGQISSAQAFNGYFSVDPGSGAANSRIGGGGAYGSGTTTAGGFGGGGAYYTGFNYDGGNGGFGGGGAATSHDLGRTGGNGGFGGGGGHGSFAGNGGFGGGGGYAWWGSDVPGGIGGVGGGGGSGTGGGGAMGAAVFVRAGGSLTLTGDTDLVAMSGGSLSAGQGGLSVTNGVAVGRGLFAMAGATLAVDLPGRQVIADDIADDSLASIPAGQHFTPGNSAGVNLVKQGSGTLVLQAPDNHYAGTTTVYAGVLQVDGALTDSPVVVAGGTLAGTGAVQNIDLGDGGSVAPGSDDSAPGILVGASLTWRGGGALRFALGAPDAATNSDRLLLSGALSKGEAGSYAFHFVPGLGAPAPGTYTVIEASGTDFAASDFSYDVTLPVAHLDGHFVVDGGTVRFVVTAVALDGLFANGFE